MSSSSFPGGVLAFAAGVCLRGWFLALGRRLGLGFGEVSLERNLGQRVRSSDGFDSGGEREHVDARGGDRGLAPVHGDDEGGADEGGHERGSGDAPFERLDVIEHHRAILAGLHGLGLDGFLLAGKGERYLDGLGGRRFSLLLALGLDPRGDQRRDGLGEGVRRGGAGRGQRLKTETQKRLDEGSRGFAGAAGQRCETHLDGDVYGERGRARILGGLALAAFGSRFLLTHGFVTLTPKLSEHFDSILLDRSTTTGRFS